MKIYKYKSHEEYVAAQVEGNKRKLKNSYVDPISLDYLTNYLTQDLKLLPTEVICHGTRRGLEQKYFRDSFLKRGVNINIVGTEISPTALNYPDTIQWDFHQIKPEWRSNIDLIYSNSFDHSYKPNECLDTWMSCLSDYGVCVLEYSDVCDVKWGKTDPFGATLDEYKELVSKKYNIIEILTNDGLKDMGETHKGRRFYIIVGKK